MAGLARRRPNLTSEIQDAEFCRELDPIPITNVVSLWTRPHPRPFSLEGHPAFVKFTLTAGGLNEIIRLRQFQTIRVLSFIT